MDFPYLVIDDDNAHEFAGQQSTGQKSTGYEGFHKPGSPHVFRAGIQIAQTIPRSEWHDRIKAGQGTFLSDLLKQKGFHAKDQNGLNYCWAYGSTRAVEAARCKEGLPFVDLAPESVGGPPSNWRNTGGYASEAFDQLQNAGACESSFLDAPHSLKHNNWKAGWQDNAKQHQAVVWQEIGTDFDQVITCLLSRRPVAAGLDWWEHLVCFLDPVILPDGSVGVLFQNSWGDDWPTAGAMGYATLTEKKATPDGAASPVLVTVDQ